MTNPEKKGPDPFTRNPVPVVLPKEFLPRYPKNVNGLLFNPDKI